FIEGVPCGLVARRECAMWTDNTPYLSFYLYCEATSDYDLWFADFTFSLTILNADETKSITKPCKRWCRMSKGTPSFGKSKCFLMETVLDVGK
ncbi:hypothetical protein PFISCL1PPCAC_21998, partial [Pristionchus fissidentatus]